MKVFSVKRDVLSEIKRLSNKIDNTVPLRKLINYEQDNYKVKPIYPEIRIYKRFYARQFIDQFIYNYSQYCRHKSRLEIETLDRSIKFVLENPLPDNIDDSWLNIQLNREAMKNYTYALREYLKLNDFKYKSAYVMTAAMGDNLIIKPNELSKRGKLRIAYDVVDGKPILSTLGYHQYMNSLYSDNDE